MVAVVEVLPDVLYEVPNSSKRNLVFCVDSRHQLIPLGTVLELDIAIVAMHSFVPQESKGRIDPEYTDQRIYICL